MGNIPDGYSIQDMTSVHAAFSRHVFLHSNFHDVSVVRAKSDIRYRTCFYPTLVTDTFGIPENVDEGIPIVTWPNKEQFSDYIRQVLPANVLLDEKVHISKEISSVTGRWIALWCCVFRVDAPTLYDPDLIPN